MCWNLPVFGRGQKQGFSGWKVHLAEGGIGGLRDITKGWFQKEKGKRVTEGLFSVVVWRATESGCSSKTLSQKPIPVIIFSPKSTVSVKQYALAVFRNTLNTQDYHCLKGVCITDCNACLWFLCQLPVRHSGYRPRGICAWDFLKTAVICMTAAS